MSSADDIQAMLDDVYGVFGVPCRWTPAGGAAVDFAGLIGGGDEVADVRGMVGRVVVASRSLRARVSELGSVAPVKGDRIDLLNGDGSVAESFVLNGEARHPDADARRLEWRLTLGAF